ncbi:hypothetical protein [Streptomyces sp. STCH 565 A]|uniref:hypothetical protein n=1 Tax=Streptomyces sp. STCH 565 A TaxID=2950532 RepID=UPI0020760E2A|nr:hypothetical protein [Streptomyces sp. STCH 565 A]MCM8548914.1 hypothetical protein [Streptomyces sp. STCH 565 A]
MSLDQPIAWTAAHPWPVALLAGVLLTVCTVIVRRTSGAVLTAGIGALVCTAYSGDTSWNFARDHLGMASVDERLVMFAAGEIALLACAVMARANKKATATATEAGTPGVPGVLVWCITGIQLVPAFAESGFWAGLVRAALGPVMAALLWHLAMGLEIRVTRPEALSTGLPAQIGHELRERLLSHLGLAVRGRTAAQVTRDRATTRAVRLASRTHLGYWGRAALKAAVARSGAATHGEQRHQLLQLLAARRNASALRTVPVVSPWTPEPVPDPYPATPLGVTGDVLRRMDPVDAVLAVHAAHPDRTPAELASLTTEYGVPVSETQVTIALRALPGCSGTPGPAVPEQPGTTVPSTVDRPELPPAPAPAAPPVPDRAAPPDPAVGLQLHLVTEPEVRPEYAAAVPAETSRTRRTRPEVHARVPDTRPTVPDEAGFVRWLAAEDHQAVPEHARTRPEVHPVPEAVPAPGSAPHPDPDPVPHPSSTADPDAPADPDGLLARARHIDAGHRRTHGRPASIKTLKRELRVGQTRATQIRAALDAEAG